MVMQWLKVVPQFSPGLPSARLSSKRDQHQAANCGQRSGGRFGQLQRWVSATNSNIARTDTIEDACEYLVRQPLKSIVQTEMDEPGVDSVIAVILLPVRHLLNVVIQCI